MFIAPGIISVSLLLSGPLAQTADRPDGPQADRGDRGDRGGRRGRPGPGGPGGPMDENQRAEWRARWERYRNATPAERQQLRMDGMVDMTARTYDLDESQKTMVRNEMLTMQAERRAAMGPDADEYDRLRDQMFQFWNQSRPEGSGNERPDFRQMRDDPKMRELRDKIRTLDQKYPFDWEKSVARIERLLPEEQVKKGRERREQFQSRWQNRGDRGDRNGNGDDRRGRRRERDDARRAFDDARRADPNAPKPDLQAAVKAEEVIKRPAGPVNPWEQYVRDFTAKNNLSAAQSASAQAILKDALARGDQVDRANADRIAEANRIEDSKLRADRLKELNGQKEQLFSELKQRLDTLLTAEQRSKSK